ncbi:hypothetical protein FRB90_010966, partial [Tulasnella sp. 427]
PIATELLLQRNPQLVNSTNPETNVTSLVEVVGQYHQNLTEATVATTSPSATAPKFPTIPYTTVYERCWCDMAASIFLSAVAIHDRFSPLPTPPESVSSSKQKKEWKSPVALFPPSGFFDPYDQSAWESASLVRHARQLMPPRDDVEEASAETNATSIEEVGQKTPEGGRPEAKADVRPGDIPGVLQKGIGGFMQRLSALKPRSGAESLSNSWRSFKSIPAGVQSAWNRLSWAGPPSAGEKEESRSPLPTPPNNPDDINNATPASSGPSSSRTELQSALGPASKLASEPEIQLPVPFGSFWMKSWRVAAQFFREKHDLTPYGFPVIVDFRWSRQA